MHHCLAMNNYVRLEQSLGQETAKSARFSIWMRQSAAGFHHQRVAGKDFNNVVEPIGRSSIFSSNNLANQ